MARYHIPTEQLEAKRDELLKQLADIESRLDRRYEDEARVEAEDLVLCRSDAGDGGWSLHAPGSTDEDIASGDAPYLASGEAEEKDGGWSRPNDQDYRDALAALTS